MMTNKLRPLQNIIALSAATLIITIWSIASYLYFNNENVKKSFNGNADTIDGSLNVAKHIPTETGPSLTWERLINKKYGYEFQYPKDWIILNTDYGNDILESDYNRGFSIHVITNDPDPDKFIQDLNNNPNFSLVKTKPIQIGRYPTIHRISTSTVLKDIQHDLWVENKNILYNFTFVSDSIVFTNTVTKILSTFKFADESNTPQVYSPLPNSKVSTPLIVKGKVPPGWMFEGQFPVSLLASDRSVISSVVAKETVPGSWSQGKDVQFEATITFTTAEKSGYLLLTNDNPSGFPENSKTFEVPVSF